MDGAEGSFWYIHRIANPSIVDEIHRGRNPSWTKSIMDETYCGHHCTFPLSEGEKKYHPEKAIHHMPYSIPLETTRSGLSGMDDEAQPKGG